MNEITQADRNWPWRVTITKADGRVLSRDYAPSFDALGFAGWRSKDDDVARVTVEVSFVGGEQVAPEATDTTGVPARVRA